MPDALAAAHTRFLAFQSLPLGVVVTIRSRRQGCLRFTVDLSRKIDRPGLVSRLAHAFFSSLALLMPSFDSIRVFFLIEGRRSCNYCKRVQDVDSEERKGKKTRKEKQRKEQISIIYLFIVKKGQCASACS